MKPIKLRDGKFYGLREFQEVTRRYLEEGLLRALAKGDGVTLRENAPEYAVTLRLVLAQINRNEWLGGRERRIRRAVAQLAITHEQESADIEGESLDLFGQELCRLCTRLQNGYTSDDARCPASPRADPDATWSEWNWSRSSVHYYRLLREEALLAARAPRNPRPGRWYSRGVLDACVEPPWWVRARRGAKRA